MVIFPDPLEQLAAEADTAGVVQLTVLLALIAVQLPEKEPVNCDVLYCQVIVEPLGTD